MGEIFSRQNRFRKWLEVELALVTVLCEDGLVPKEDLDVIQERADFDIARIDEVEAEVGHDVIAFLTAVAEKVGPASRHIHFGMTSSDVVDTALALQVKEAAAIILPGIDKVIASLAKLALEHRGTACIGRTHGIHAELTTFGLKMARFHEEVRRARARVAREADQMAVGKLSGAVGTAAHLSPDIEERVLARLGLRPEPVASQVVSRERHAGWVASLALLGACYENIATEIRALQRTDLHEAEEPFRKGQKGSSAMPHKRNPILCENLCGLARLLRSHATAAMENVALWHERDISHSSVERIIIPDSAILADFMSHRLNRVLSGLRLFPESMQANIDKTGGLVFSGELLLALAASGLTREEAYRMVQGHAMAVFEEGGSLKERIEADQAIRSRLSREEIDRAFSEENQLRHVDEIFDRVFAKDSCRNVSLFAANPGSSEGSKESAPGESPVAAQGKPAVAGNPAPAEASAAPNEGGEKP